MKKKPRAIRVRIAVAVDAEGRWAVNAREDTTPEKQMREVDSYVQSACPESLIHYWITAEILLPVVGEVAGAVEPAKENHT